MCGICGIADFNSLMENKTRRTLTMEMSKLILHRGPDENGIFHDDQVSLAMRRLSIIDLRTGSQPIYDASKKHLIIFNGEIYNFLELRKELKAAQNPFQTSSDTEVILALYLKLGIAAFRKLRGMFAVCIYDLEKKEVLLARDFFGEKPLYYWVKDEMIAFSSELHSLSSFKLIPRKLSHEALDCFLFNGMVPEPLTFFEGIYSLPPGHFLQFAKGKKIVAVYQQETEEAYKQKSVKHLDEAISLIKPLFETSVKRQMVSDVPIGAFLSGGIDSSTVVATMQKVSSTPVKTFTVKMEDQGYDESALARRVSEKIGTEHHEITLGDQSFDERYFWLILRHVGQPFSDTSAIPTYLITREIGKYVKVTLSGDGGDELFAGYTHFQWYKKITALEKWPGGLRKLGMSAVATLGKASGMSVFRQVRKALETSLRPEEEYAAIIHRIFDNKEFQQIRPSLFNKVPERFKTYYDMVKNESDLKKVMHYRFAYNLPINMLIKVDRMSMANSVEVRSPFLDIDLYKAALSLDDDLLVNGDKGKYIVRKMMENDLPNEVFDHPKTGFAIPMSKFVNQDFWKLTNHYLNDHCLKIFSVVPHTYVQKLLNSIKSGNYSQAEVSTYKQFLKIWSLLMLSAWFEKYSIDV